ncbi:MAG: pilus assembly PilX N-terminal domain-containing protein [Planctomycetota bacterium]|jgi:hypothetical protein
MKSQRISKGSALLLSIIILATLSAWAVFICSVSGTNLQIAENQRKGDSARASAESGIEITRYWLSKVMMPSSTAHSAYLATVVADLQSKFTDNGISNIVVANDGTISAVTLDSAAGRTFSGRLAVDPNHPTVLQLYVTGSSGELDRKIGVSYNFEAYEFPIFNYGLATKGALHFPGNPTVRGATSSWEADIYIESPGDLIAAYSSGNVNFDGDISIGNPLANVDFQQDIQIAGEHGQTALDNHVITDAGQVEFPVPETAPFRPYATGDVINSGTDVNDSMTLTNVVIEAGTNPTFAGNVIIEGILLIEQPNIVTFDRNVQLNGMVVGDGDVSAAGQNSVTFKGNFATGPFPNGSEFDQIRSEAGTSILAPGFATSFEGNFSTLDGVVAVSGVTFSGNISADIKGTIINYSESPLTVEGNATMVFDRSASTKVPAGFDLWRVLDYNPSSYTEVMF